MYVVAIKDAKAWKGETPFELSMVGFWNLMVVWLKVCRVSLPVCHGNTDEIIYVAITTLEVLPPMGARRRNRGTREHGQVYGEQLFNARFLEELA